MDSGALIADEIRRLTRTLEGRFADHPDVRAVGFGAALKGGHVDPDRPFVVRLWIDEKVRDPQRIPRARVLPDSVQVRLKRGRGFDTLTLPIDVEELDPIRATALIMPGSVTTSGVVRWRTAPYGQFDYGFVTCAHGFKAVPIEPGGVLELRRGNGAALTGALRWQSPDTRPVDVAIVGSAREDVHAWLGGELPQSVQPVVGTGALPLLCAFKQLGRTLADAGGTALRYLSYTPGPIRLAPELPPLRHVVEAEAVPMQTFRPGTSGALWGAEAGLVGVQVAGRFPHFQRGYAVSLRSSLGQAFVGLGAQRLDVVGEPV